MKSPRKRNTDEEQLDKSNMQTARGRLKGALKDIIDPSEDEEEEGEQSDAAENQSAVSSKGRATKSSGADDEEDVGDRKHIPLRGRPPKRIRREALANQSYVMKLFDRSVDLAKYNESSPLYPICRDWIINEPHKYRKIGRQKQSAVPIREKHENMMEMLKSGKLKEVTTLPAPLKMKVSRVPELISEQLNIDKNNINLNYDLENPPLSRAELLTEHRNRWSQIRKKWVYQSQLCDEKYKSSLNIINMIGLK